MNNKKIKKLAEKAGFIYWGKEEWGPGPDFIDWSSSYDNELVKFTKLIVQECIKINKVESSDSNLPEYNLGMLEGYRRARENISTHFGVNND